MFNEDVALKTLIAKVRRLISCASIVPTIIINSTDKSKYFRTNKCQLLSSFCKFSFYVLKSAVLMSHGYSRNAKCVNLKCPPVTVAA